jgi:hypothetical protein
LDKRIHELFDYNDAKVKGATKSSQLKQFFRARQEAMLDQLNSYSIKVMENTEATNEVTKIESKIVRKSEGGEEFTEKKNEITKRKEALEKEKTKLTDPEKAAKDYQKAQEDLSAAQESFQKDFPVEAASGDSFDLIIQKLNNKLKDSKDKTSITYRRQKIYSNRQVAMETALGKALGGLPAKADAEAIKSVSAGVRESINEAYQSQLDLLNQEADEITLKINNLKDLKTKIENAQKASTEKSHDLLGYSAKTNLATVENNYKIIGTGGLPNSVGLDDSQLGVMSVDEIMVEINRVYAGDPTKGWAEALNYDPANRRMVIDAMAEAKARFAESIDPDKPARDVDFTRITGWAITDTQLRSLSRSQLLNMIHIAHGVNPANGWGGATPALTAAEDTAHGAELDRAMEEAKNRMRLRYGGIVQEQVVDYQTQIDAAQEEITNINFKDDIDILTSIKDVMSRQGQVFDLAYQLATNRAGYVDVAKIDPTDVYYSQFEKDLSASVPGVSKGYWEMMDMIFGYKKRVDGSSFVQKIYKTLPPDAMAKQINEALRLAGLKGIPGIGAPNYGDLDLALKKLNKGIESKAVNSYDMRRMVADIINSLRARTESANL